MMQGETLEAAVGRRLIGIAAQLGHHAPPETVERDARAALNDLAAAPAGIVTFYARDLALLLIAHATAVAPEARERADRCVAVTSENLRGAIAMDEITGRAA